MELEQEPPFARPGGMLSGGARSMADIVATVERYPFEPVRMPVQVAFFRDFGPDALGLLFSANPATMTLPHSYPSAFRPRLVTGEGGVQLAAMQAMHEHPGPALVICHGMLMTKNFDAIIQLARRAYEEWGFHVVTFDQRGWGQSAWTTDMPPSAGYFEGRDVVEIARLLHEHPLVTSVGAVGFSLGGSAVLNASLAASDADDQPLDGGVVAISAPSDMEVAVAHISRRPRLRDPFTGPWHVFQAAIRANVRHRQLRRDLHTWEELVAEMSAPVYGVPLDEFYARASARTFADRIRVPTLALHAGDDFLVPPVHAEWLREAAADNEHVHVMVRSSGNHCSFAAVDDRWFHSVVRRFVEYWAVPGDAVGGAAAGHTEPQVQPIDPAAR